MLKLFKISCVALMLSGSISIVNAAEYDTPSYSLKKQGRVHFKQAKKDVKDAYSINDTAKVESFDPAKIEPAAGDETIFAPDTKTSLQKQMQLPRK